jgi:hypothetical protein
MRYWGGNLSPYFVWVWGLGFTQTYLRSFFLDPEDIRKLHIGTIWNFVKEQGSSNLVQNMRHKGPVLRPRCIGPGRAQTQIPFNSIQIRLHTATWRILGWGHTILTSRELMWYYVRSWDVTGGLTLNYMTLIHSSVTLLTSRGALVSSRASTPLTFLLSHTSREAWPTCRVQTRWSRLTRCVRQQKCEACWRMSRPELHVM